MCIIDYETFFCKYELSQYLEFKKFSIKKAVDELDKNRFIASTVEDLVGYFVDLFRVEPLCIYEDDMARTALKKVKYRFSTIMIYYLELVGELPI